MQQKTFLFDSPQAGTYICEKHTPADGRTQDGVEYYRIRMSWTETAAPRTVVLRFSLPAEDTYSAFDCRRFDRAKSWGGVERTSRLGADLPLLQLVSKSDTNRLLLTLSDVKNPTKLKISCDYKNMSVKVEISFFTELTAPMNAYTCLLRLDVRPQPFYAALADAKRWFADLGYVSAKTPAAAENPLYSTWYSYLTEITAADVLRECETAKQLGMDTVIIDDGWQRENGASAYGYCGDWEPYPEKFPDMKGLVRALHGLGMKVVLWYSVPFVGQFSKNYDRFRGKYLRDVPECDCSVLDPRYSEIRAFIADTYVRAVREWELDGLKLDFIDRFAANGEVTDAMDYVSVEDAVESLLSEIYEKLTAVNPEIMIEFRQPYSGPVIGAFGNMLRAWDCPNDGMTNRVATLNLRLTTDACVHADPIGWSSAETPEQAATLLWGTAFSVPQISLRLQELTAEQLAVLRRYLGFWRAHRETLLHGALTAQAPECMYALTAAVTQRETFILCCAQSCANVTGAARAYVCNLTATETLILKTAAGAVIRVLDCFGNCLREQTATGALTECSVPVGGMAEIISE